MANITGTVRDIGPAALGGFVEGFSTIEYNDGYVAAVAGAPGIIRCPGIIPGGGGTSGSSGSITTLRLYHAANATLGSSYETLKVIVQDKAKSDSVATGTGTDAALEEWATVAGDMDGVSINVGAVMPYTISGKRATSTIEDAHLEMTVWHKDVPGAETLLATEVFADLTTSYQDFTGNWGVSSDQAFATNEILVVKIRLYNDGAPA